MHGHYAILIVQGAEQSAGQFANRMTLFFELNEWAKYAAEIFAMVLAAAVLRLLGRLILGPWAGRLQKRRKHLVELTERLLTPVLVIGVFSGAFHLLPMSDKWLRILDRMFYVAMLVLGIYCVSKVALIVLDQWLEKDESRKTLREPTEFAVRVIFAALGTMLLLENLGISLTSVWTTLGVGSVAIALALQDTLSNFFAGVYLRIDRPISLGDYIKLQSGEEGYVGERGWRSTRIQALSGHFIVIPNSKLATTILTNYSLPNTRLPISILFSVSMTSDLEGIEGILMEEANAAAGKIPGLPSDAAPSVQFAPNFGHNSLDFTLNCTVSSYVDQYSVQNELRKRIFHRFRSEKIEFPVLQREVRVSGVPQPREPGANHANGAIEENGETVPSPPRPKEMSRGTSGS
jgi:small-conductance mechanosensitive channel